MQSKIPERPLNRDLKLDSHFNNNLLFIIHFGNQPIELHLLDDD